MGALGIPAVEGSPAAPVAVSIGVARGAAGIAPLGQAGLAALAARSRCGLDRHARLSRTGGEVIPRTVAGAAMTSPREVFLQRVRQALATGNRAGSASA